MLIKKIRRRVSELPAEMRSFVKQARRSATANQRSLPHYIIIGTQKGGTGALFHYLNKHPETRRGTRKEIHFYDRRYDKGLRWYRSQFPLKQDLPDDVVVGEATPTYLTHPHAAKRIAETQPDVKMIALLRNPKSRAVSHYYRNLRKNREDLPIDEAMYREEERISAEWERMLNDESYTSRAYRFYSYKHRGRYAEQLRRFYEYFPRDQILVINNADLWQNTGETLKEVCDFLGISAPPEDLDTDPIKVSGYSKDLPDGLDEYLDEYFRPLNQDLYQLLGRDFGW